MSVNNDQGGVRSEKRERTGGKNCSGMCGACKRATPCTTQPAAAPSGITQEPLIAGAVKPQQS